MFFYENPAEYTAIYGGDECGAGVRGMQSPSTLFKMPRLSRRGGSLKKKNKVWQVVDPVFRLWLSVF